MSCATVTSAQYWRGGAGGAVLAGQRSYDTLPAREQAVVRAEWDERITATRAELDLVAEFTAAGRSWTEIDENGDLVVKNASGHP